MCLSYLFAQGGVTAEGQWRQCWHSEADGKHDPESALHLIPDGWKPSSFRVDKIATRRRDANDYWGGEESESATKIQRGGRGRGGGRTTAPAYGGRGRGDAHGDSKGQGKGGSKGKGAGKGSKSK